MRARGRASPRFVLRRSPAADDPARTRARPRAGARGTGGRARARAATRSSAGRCASVRCARIGPVSYSPSSRCAVTPVIVVARVDGPEVRVGPAVARQERRVHADRPARRDRERAPAAACVVQNQLTMSSGARRPNALDRPARASRPASSHGRARRASASSGAARRGDARLEPRVDDLVPVAREQQRRERQPEERDRAPAPRARSAPRAFGAPGGGTRRRPALRRAAAGAPLRIACSTSCQSCAAVGRAPEEPDRDAEAPLVAAAAAVGAPLVVVAERLLEPHRGIDARRVRAERALDVLVADDAVDDARCRCPRAARGSRPPARSCRARPRGTKPTPAMAKLRRTISAERRARDDVHRARRDEAAAQVREEVAVAHLAIALAARKSAARASMKSSVSVARPCMSAVAMRRSSSTSASRGASSSRYSTKIVAVAAGVEAQIDEARLRRRGRAVVVDDREDLVARRRRCSSGSSSCASTSARKSTWPGLLARSSSCAARARAASRARGSRGG